MKYLCLVYIDDSNLEAAPAGECLVYAATLRDSGECLAAEALQSVDAAAPVWIRGGGLSTTDGPFIETKEHLAGFYLLDVEDLDEAVRLAARIPPPELVSVEIRPVRELAPPPGSPARRAPLGGTEDPA